MWDSMSDKFQMIKIFLYKAGGVVKVSIKEKQKNFLPFDDTKISSNIFNFTFHSNQFQIKTKVNAFFPD